MILTKTKMLLAFMSLGLSIYAISTKNYSFIPYSFLILCSIYLLDAVQFFSRYQTKKAYLFLDLAALFGTYAGMIH